jgi:hypothetical protein
MTQPENCKKCPKLFGLPRSKCEYCPHCRAGCDGWVDVKTKCICKCERCMKDKARVSTALACMCKQ